MELFLFCFFIHQNQRSFSHQIDILSGLRKLLWTKEGKESINAAKSDKEKLVSLLVNASDQVFGFNCWHNLMKHLSLLSPWVQTL